MRKFIKLLILVAIITAFGTYFARNHILKYVLEDRFSQMNQAYVKIGAVESHLFDEHIVLHDIHIESHEYKGKDFIQIQELRTYYQLDYNHRKINLYDTEIIGLHVVTQKDPKVLKHLKEEKAVQLVEKDNLFNQALQNILQEETEEVEASDEFQNIKEAFKNMKLSKAGLQLDIDSIKENLDRMKNKYLGEEQTEKYLDTDYVFSQYINASYEERLYDFLLKYREITKELEERIVKDRERNDSIWEVQMHKISIFFDLYGINFNGEISNLNSRLSKNTEDISFKFFGEKGDTIGMAKGKLNLLDLCLESSLDIPEFDLCSLPEAKKYLSQGEASLQQKMELDRYNLRLNGNVIAKKLKLRKNPFVQKVEEVEVKYQYDSRTRKLFLKTQFLKNRIDELEIN